MSDDVYNFIATVIVILVFVAIVLFLEMVRNRRGDRAGIAFLLLAVVSAIALAAALWSSAARAADCACLRNGDGACMTLARTMYPYRQFDEYLEGPHCVTGCYPGFSDVYGYSRETRAELARCRIDWPRLRRELERDGADGWK